MIERKPDELWPAAKRAMLKVSSLPSLAVILLFAGTAPRAAAQYAPGPLDPTRTAALSIPARTSLPEAYVWTAGDVTAQRADARSYPWNRADLRNAPHLFRARFRLNTVPDAATLYLAGPREMTVFVNGRRVGHFSTNVDQPINFRVFHLDVRGALHAGDNVLAVEAIRGRGVVSVSGSAATQQLAYGEVLAAKLLPAAFGEYAPAPLLISDGSWRSTAASGATLSGWSDSGFDDSHWQPVMSLGPIESNPDFLQWSIDAGMYGWPGYSGMSPSLRNYALAAVAVSHIYQGDGSLAHFESLHELSPAQPFRVTRPDPDATDAEVPSLLLDFGREVAGRILVESASEHESRLSIAYGESELEALATGITPTQRGGNYLGTNLLEVPAHGVARGPKSAFRYVRIRFLRTSGTAVYPSIRLEGIAYPVVFRGSFTSSDPLLNRIWETAAYTAHLCMQDGVWDAPKRDRGRWAGDLDIEGRVIYDSYGDTAELEDTLAHLAQETHGENYVDGIPSYSALWITTLATLYAQSGDRAFVAAQHDAVLRLLGGMDEDLDPGTGLLKPLRRGWGFVDWSPGLYGPTREVWMGTTLQYLRSYVAAPSLLRAAGDEEHARRYEEIACRVRQAAQKEFISPETHTVGETWQLNALAVLTGAAGGNEDAIWSRVLAHAKQDSPADAVISPYFNEYVLDAMAQSGHAQDALNWMRTYWGGMLAEGATSFWESYDLRWPKTDYHLSLQADGTSGFFVSLAHGWSSGPAAWIAENILGVRPMQPGYAAVSIKPQLLGLKFAKGTVPTPHGTIAVEMDSDRGLTLDLPPGVDHAEVVVPRAAGMTRLYVNGTQTQEAAEGSPLHLHSGHYQITWR